jgi:integrase
VGGVTVDAFMAQWLEAVRPWLRASTWRRYEQYARLHALPALGALRLEEVGALQLHLLYAERLAAGCSPTSVRHLHRFLHRVFAHAVRWGEIAHNPVDRVDPPRVLRHEFRTLSVEQAQALLAALRGDRLHALYMLALTTGMRQGELFALRWADVDLPRRRLAVRGTLYRGTGGGWIIGEPKTARSRRQVVLSPPAVRALESHRALLDAERSRTGDRWEDNDLVFPNQVGRPMNNQNFIARHFRPLLQRAGLPLIRFHDLRHTAATLLLAADVHPKIVSELLGHASVTTTIDLYSHVTAVMHEAAALALGELLTEPDR